MFLFLLLRKIQFALTFYIDYYILSIHSAKTTFGISAAIHGGCVDEISDYKHRLHQ
jgi:hypothetical protein